jgi:hypothetical protein
MPAKVNCLSAWVNHTPGRSAQNGGTGTATLHTSAGGELSAASMPRQGHQCRMSNPVARRDKHVKLQQMFIAVRLNITDEQGSRAYMMNFVVLSYGMSLNTITDVLT